MFQLDKQQQLWGMAESTCLDLGTTSLTTISQKELNTFFIDSTINSVRIFTDSFCTKPFHSGVIALYYPKPTTVPDIFELIPKVNAWIDSTSQSMGNWISKEETLEDLSQMDMKAVPCYDSATALQPLNHTLKTYHSITLVGFDLLQVPRCKKTLILHL